ncbi:type IV toxin-antitoxin system AbiEi family antitoxin [Aeoliella sp. SH292]|uniref:type IV toxin-antitoxin system AbiEi family antitoxin n=1 Tax=Aeoliella sp. SH292 TaxID=3454464 RepID=UPI003F9902D2
MHNESKLKKLLDNHLSGTVYVASWLEDRGISRALQQRYRKSGWLETAGTGAFKRPGEQVTWQGGLYALQSQSGLAVHAGALTALALQGYAHYLRLGAETVFLFSPPKTSLPAWFKNRDWGQHLHHCKTSVLPPELALADFQVGAFSVKISAPERAILECLHLSPSTLDLVECYQLLEGLTTLRPKLLQPLLEQCSSIKIKRLFLYMAEKAGHDWFQRLDIAKFDLGAGARTITKGGVYVSRYGLTLPEELVNQ